MSHLGIIKGRSNEDYHKGPGLSRSQLKYYQEHPSTFRWSLTAPEDETKSASLDFGTLFHWRCLEYTTDPKRYVPMEKFGLTKEEKAKKENFLEAAEMAGRTVCTSDELRKVEIMYRSALAHPHARELLELPGEAEVSIYWKDEETGELLKCRPDRIVIIDGIHYLVDVKTTDSIEKFLGDAWGGSFYDYGYHEQAAFYVDGYRAAMQLDASVIVRFVFIVVSTTVNCRKYPVGVFQMPADLIREGRENYKKTVAAIHYSQTQNDWGGLRVLKKPYQRRKSQS